MKSPEDSTEVTADTRVSASIFFCLKGISEAETMRVRSSYDRMGAWNEYSRLDQ
jgi:hypothetical protein